MKKTEAEYKRDSGSLGKCKFKKKTLKKNLNKKLTFAHVHDGSQENNRYKNKIIGKKRDKIIYKNDTW